MQYPPSTGESIFEITNNMIGFIGLKSRGTCTSLCDTKQFRLPVIADTIHRMLRVSDSRDSRQDLIVQRLEVCNGIYVLTLPTALRV